MAQTEFWQGNKAIAMGAIAAGCRFYGGYPITPSTEIMETMSEELPKLGGKFIQMEVPLVLADVQRGGPSTGLPPNISQADVMQAKFGPNGDHATIADVPN